MSHHQPRIFQNKIRVQFDFNLFLCHGYIGLGYVICHQPIENKYTKYLFRQVDNFFLRSDSFKIQRDENKVSSNCTVAGHIVL